MTALEELHALYEQWRILTEEEGAAIDHGDWTLLAQCQTGKSRLQPRVAELSQLLEPALLERQFRPVVEQLMELERRNQERLRARQQNAEAQRLALERSRRHLRQLHQSYVPPSQPHWQSYS